MRSAVLAAVLAIGTFPHAAQADWVSSGWSYYDEDSDVDPANSGGAAGFTYSNGDPYVYAYVSQEDARAFAQANFFIEFQWQGSPGFGIYYFDVNGRVTGSPSFIEPDPGGFFGSWVQGIVVDSGPQPGSEGYVTADHYQFSRVDPEEPDFVQIDHQLKAEVWTEPLDGTRS